jgi:hypothetical protein
MELGQASPSTHCLQEIRDFYLEHFHRGYFKEGAK